MSISVTQVENTVRLCLPTPVGFGDELVQLMGDISDVCGRLREQDRLPMAVVLQCGSRDDPFFVCPPRSPGDCDRAAQAWGQATAAVADIEAPTVAVMAGDAIGPAWELALACDLRIASTEAHVGSPEIRFGRVPAAGATQRLPRIGRPGVALELLLLGEIVTASRALDLGLVHRVAPPAELDAALESLLEDLRRAAPIASAYTKEAVHRGCELPLADGLRLEADLSALLQTTADRAGGISAFNERRAPRFDGR